MFNLSHALLNSRYWKDHDKFRPEHFLTEDGKVFKPDHYMPFGSGEPHSQVAEGRSFREGQ